jgi:hypothetical protein
MKNAETHSSESSYIGHVKNGVVVLDPQVPLTDGQAVRVEPLGSGAERHLDTARADRVRQLQELFAEWTEEDGKLSDEEADRLHVALGQSRGLSFRSPNLD